MGRVQLNIATHKATEFMDITTAIEKIISEHKIGGGTVSLFLAHTTAALTTIAFNPSQDLDILATIETILPGKSAKLQAHSKLPLYIVASFLGQHLSVPVERGKLLLGEMQRIILVELNGPRERKIIMDWNV